MTVTERILRRIFAGERLCPDCKGVGWYWGADDWQHPCEACGGKGKIKNDQEAD